jgi:hypothetical protein
LRERERVFVAFVAFLAPAFLVFFAAAFDRAGPGPRSRPCAPGSPRSGHEVDDLGRLLDQGRGDDLLAGRLLLDDLEELLAVGVGVLLGLEVARQRLDELPRHVELLLARRDVVAAGDLLDALERDDLVGVPHGLDAQRAVERTDGDEVLLGAAMIR